MWPFKKKAAEKTNNEALPVQRIINETVNFQHFGSSSINWIKLVSDGKKQDDFLLIDYFNQLPEVSSPILKFAEKMPDVNIYFQDKNGKDITNHEAIPIVTRFWEKHIQLLTIYDLLLGNTYIQAFQQPTFESRGVSRLNELYLLPSEYTTIRLKKTTQDFRQLDIDSYNVRINSNTKELNIAPENILHIKNDSFFKTSDMGLYGISKLVSCEKNIQAIASGYGARISLYDNGARVIITGKSKDNDFNSINETETTEEINKRANDVYGRTYGQYQIMVTKVPLDVTNISLNVEDLQLNQMNSADFRRICNLFGQDSKIHGDPEATTYDNMQTAMSDFYNGAFKKKANQYATELTRFINAWYDDIQLRCDFSNIKEIAEFEAQQEEKLFEKVEKGLMTRNEFLAETGRNVVDAPEFNEYYVYGNDGKWYRATGQEQNVSDQQVD